MEKTDTFDAIVVGGGPGGSFSAFKLAKLGRRVLLLERAEHPRFHIGESMLPYMCQILKDQGLWERVQETPATGRPGTLFTRKWGVEVNYPAGDFKRVKFSLLAPGQEPQSYNLDRTRFDALMLDIARENGAKIETNAEVKKFLFDGDRIAGVEYESGGAMHQVRAPYVIDASGRAGLITTKVLKSRKMNKRLDSVAFYQHFADLKDANLPPAADWADLVMASVCPEGWVWGIPIAPDVLSIGVVVPSNTVRGRTPTEIFNHWLDRCPRLKHRVQGSRPVFDPVKVESDFNYHSDKLSGPGFFVVGDAGCFVDPCFSGGLYLAMLGGLKAAEAIDQILGGTDERSAQKAFDDFCKTGTDTYFRLLYLLWEGSMGDLGRMFEAPPPEGRGFPGGLPYMMQTLCGDFWGPADQPLLKFIREKPEWATFEEPFDFVYTCPVYPHHAYSPRTPPGEAFEKEVMNGGRVFRNADGTLKMMMKKDAMAHP